MNGSKRGRRRSTFNELYLRKDDVLSKRGCFDSTVSADHEPARSGQIKLSRSEDRPGLVNGGHHEDITGHPLISHVPFSPLNLDREATGSLHSQHYRRLPVVPKPRFPVTMLPTPSLTAMFAPSASMTASLHNITPLTPPPFRFTPSVDCSTAVPSSSPTLPPPPSSLFALYHPAFWRAMPYLIGRALLNAEQVREDPTLDGSRFPIESDPQLPWPGQCQSSSKFREPPTVNQRFCDLAFPPPDVSLRPSQEAASSGLEDMAKMVNQLDKAKKMIT